MNTLIDVLRDLVALHTVSVQPTRAAIDFISGFLEEHGYRSQIFGDDRHQNLICRNQAAIDHDPPDGKYLAFCAHIDTVPFDRDLWSSDPLRLEERQGRLYGLGAADMKGPLACMMLALRELAQRSPEIPAALVVTHHEETALEGARELVASSEAMAALRPMQLIIGEPTGLALGYAHKGVFDYTITVSGRAAHSGNPQEGLNAIYGAARIAARIGALNDRWRDEAGKPERANIVNLGTFRAGDVRNRVPDLAILSGDMRLVPGSSSAVLRDGLEQEFQLLTAEGYGCELRMDYEAMPFEMPLAHGLVAELMAVMELPVIRLGYATDAAVFQEAGVECVILGPGDISVCHMPDEFIEQSQLEAGLATYLRLVIARNDLNQEPAEQAAQA